MPLRDHFRPPLSLRRHWHALHNGWATFLASDLNARLPEGYFAEPNVQFGIEIDVAAFEDEGGPAGGVGWSPPPPAQTVALPILTDIAEVAVYHAEAGPVLAGAIELVSPANKDRDAFVAKCRSYLQQGIGLLLVDVVTDRRANLHDELLARLDPGAAASGDDLYTAAYRTVERDGQPRLDVWREALAVGGELPTMPLWLRGPLCLPVDLGATYERACREQRIPPAGP